jgi:photosystem I subunit III
LFCYKRKQSHAKTVGSCLCHLSLVQFRTESIRFRSSWTRNTTTDPESGKKRFARYSQALCGPEGLPHLIVDGRLDRAGDFLIPGVLFLYIAGWIGWVGRAYLIAIKKGSDTEEKEIIIDVPLAVSCMLGGFAWPAAALGEFTSGKLLAKDNEITVSPR